MRHTPPGRSPGLPRRRRAPPPAKQNRETPYAPHHEMKDRRAGKRRRHGDQRDLHRQGRAKPRQRRSDGDDDRLVEDVIGEDRAGKIAEPGRRPVQPEPPEAQRRGDHHPAWKMRTSASAHPGAPAAAPSASGSASPGTRTGARRRTRSAASRTTPPDCASRPRASAARPGRPPAETGSSQKTAGAPRHGASAGVQRPLEPPARRQRQHDEQDRGDQRAKHGPEMVPGGRDHRPALGRGSGRREIAADEVGDPPGVRRA